MMRVACLSCWLVLLAVSSVASVAQFVSGEWVQQGEAVIQQTRTTPVKFLVLDARGRLAAGATVHVEQLSHAFAVGFAVDEKFPEGFQAGAPVWRVFNRVSLDRLTPWRTLQPHADGELRTEALDKVITDAERAGLGLRWGALLSADVFDMPEWAVKLKGESLSDASSGYLDAAAKRYGSRLSDMDLLTPTLQNERFSPAMVRLLGMRMRAALPGSAARARFEDALAGPTVFDVLQAVDGLVGQRVGLDGFTLEQAFDPVALDAGVLTAAIQRLAKFGLPMVAGRLEVTGSSSIEATVNLETVVRVLFAEPMVTGIYLGPVAGKEVADTTSALFDEKGQPTGAGQALDDLFRKKWWTDALLTANELGEADVRAFFGRHRVTATLQDGGTVTTELELPMGGDAAVVILQPIE